MRLSPEKSQECQARAMAHEGGGDTAVVTLICGERVAQIPTGIMNMEIAMYRGEPINRGGVYRAERIATEALEGFCINCRNRRESEEGGGTVVAFPPTGG